MKQESIEEAIKIITDNIYNSGINVIDKYELLLNINHFLTHYEEETGSKVLKKVKNDSICKGNQRQ